MLRKLTFATLSLTVLTVLLPAIQAQNVVTDWTAIASQTIIHNAQKPPAAGTIFFAYAAIASYDAVNAIDRRHEPFYYTDKAPKKASQDAAALAAAHAVLVYYFPTQQSSLDSAYATSLAAIGGSPSSKSDGVAVGEAAAAALIAARTGDGLEANVPYTPGSGPGVWQPTPPAYAPAAVPWVGQMRPFTMKNADQFLPPGPPSLSSSQWQRDYIITATLGAANGSPRTPTQTEIGLFYTETPGQQYARAFIYLAIAQHLNVAESSRLMAMLWTGGADATIGCWNAKYHYNFWRPVTAIPVGGGNSELTADPSWSAEAATPPHPEYPSAHSCFTTALASVIEGYFGTPNVHFVIDSLAFTPAHTHVFDNIRDLPEEVFWARIYTGFHYYNSLKDGAALGQGVARQLLKNNFRPRND